MIRFSALDATRTLARVIYSLSPQASICITAIGFCYVAIVLVVPPEYPTALLPNPINERLDLSISLGHLGLLRSLSCVNQTHDTVSLVRIISLLPESFIVVL